MLPIGAGESGFVSYLSHMKNLILCLLTLSAFMSCGPTVPQADSGKSTTVIQTQDPPAMKTYNNERFRRVWVLKSNDNTYRVTGQARVFEATLNYAVVHNNQEMLTGFATASTGAPEWGDFSFTFTLETPSDQNAELLLFEISAKDGARTHTLNIPLP